MTDLAQAQAVATDHDFCWRVAGACVHVAGKVESWANASPAQLDLASRAIWDWTAVGLIFARFLAYQGVAADTPDAALIEAVFNAWPTVSRRPDPDSPSEES